MKRFTQAALVAAVLSGASGVLAIPAQAAVQTALQRCQAGTAADVTQTVFHAGTKPQVTYPNVGTNPDNGVYPGDVVKVTVTGSLRYDATHYVGPNGLGTGAGIRPYSSTATWNNNPGGWVGAEMRTTSLAACTSAPSIAARLIYRIKDTNLANNAGGFTITTKVWRAPGRISIDGTEVTQGVQNATGQVPLIAGKRTFVRVYLRHKDDGLGALSGVTGTLTVPGVPVTAYPLVNTSITTSTTGSDKRVFAGSLLFEIPANALGGGQREAVVTVRPPSNRGGGHAIVRHIPLSFGPTTSLNVIGIRTSYYNVPTALTNQLKATQPGLNVAAGWWQARPIAAWEPLRLMAENSLPLAKLTITEDAPASEQNSVWGTAWFDCKAVQNSEGAWSCGGYADAKTWLPGYADTLCPNGGCFVMLLQPEINDRENGTAWGSTKGNKVMNMQGERQPTSQGNTLAHEIGHHLALDHTWEDASYPRSDGGLGPIVALRYAPTFALVSGRNAAGTTTAYDLMSYDRPAWFSVYSYCKAMAHLPSSHPLCAPGISG